MTRTLVFSPLPASVRPFGESDAPLSAPLNNPPWRTTVSGRMCVRWGTWGVSAWANEHRARAPPDYSRTWSVPRTLRSLLLGGSFAAGRSIRDHGSDSPSLSLSCRLPLPFLPFLVSVPFPPLSHSPSQ